MSMAFQATSSGQEIKNRKLLEQLEEQKKRLRLQSHGGAAAAGSSAGSTANTPSVPTPPVSQLPPAPVQPPPASILFTDQQHMTPQQRAALQHAHANSVGYYITQDSSFGNLILPVLPRFDKTATE
ncbi:SOSS complex subunit C-like [Gigantopelta aegis]|uniref:SOSS complex subunit C-like n=1 Tax=Gigantopelta aegis TaxID=1735272 RepID=UPI001B887F04|nr:SOSS complex subunit C-like [Gigantopelta aegis]